MDSVREYPRGKIVIEEGSHGTSAFVILSGAAEVLKKLEGREILLATLGVGQVFGEMGLIEDRPRSASVRALSDLSVRVIDRDQFNRLLPTRPAVLIPIMKSLFERLRQASDMLTELNAPQETTAVTEHARYDIIMEGQTAEAERVLDGRKLLISKFPFLVGRDSLNSDSDVFYNNDLAVPEDRPYVVSRNHLAVVRDRGKFWVVDRGSTFGTIVNGREIGGGQDVTRAPLNQEKNQVIIGPVTSKYIFLLNVTPLPGKGSSTSQ